MKPEQFRFTDIQRLEIFDCLPEDSPDREIFLEKLEWNIGRIKKYFSSFLKMAKPERIREKEVARRALDDLLTWEESFVSLKTSFLKLIWWGVLSSPFCNFI